MAHISQNSSIIFIIGATASGKSSLALSLAQAHNGIIINADALQIYHDFQILTARPTKSDIENVPHFLYGFLPIDASYNVAQWCQDVQNIIHKTWQETPNRKIFIVGGTGLYVKSLIQGIAKIPDIPEDIRKDIRQMDMQSLYKALQTHDMEAIEKIHPNDAQRLARAYEVIYYTGKSIYDFHRKAVSFLPKDIKTQAYRLNPERNILYARINQRFDQMIENGAIDEVQKVMHHDTSYQSMKVIGVKEICAYLKEEISLEEAIEKSKQASRNYAKRQTTFFNNQFSNFANLK